MKKINRMSGNFDHLRIKTNLFSLSGALLLSIIFIGGYGSVMISYLYNATQETQSNIKILHEQALTVKHAINKEQEVQQETLPTETRGSETFAKLIVYAEEIIANSNATTEKAEQGIRFGFLFLVSIVLGMMTIKSLKAARKAKLRKIKTIENLIKKIENTPSTSAERSFSVKDISSQLQKTSSQSLNEMKSPGGSTKDQENASLTDTTRKIGGVMGMINHIAKDINLLALNATIEAGHADKSGKGFSAMTMEVKTLANQSKKACGEIETLIQNVQGVPQEIITVLNTTITNVRGISEYTQEISSNTPSSQDANISYKQVIDAAQLLSEESEILSEEMQNFLVGIQEAS